MNGMVINSSTNNSDDSMNIVLKWCDMKHNRLIVPFDDRFVEYGLIAVIVRMEWFEFLMYRMNTSWYHWIWWMIDDCDYIIVNDDIQSNDIA